VPEVLQEGGNAVIAESLAVVEVKHFRLETPYSSGVMLSLSFRSAPAQKATSLSLARMRARVLPIPRSRCRPSTTPLSSESSWREMALRARGRLKETTAMLPAWGAGTLEILMVDDSDVVAYCRLSACHGLAEPERPKARGSATVAMLYPSSHHRRARRDVEHDTLTGCQPNCRPAPDRPGMIPASDGRIISPPSCQSSVPRGAGTCGMVAGATT